MSPTVTLPPRLFTISGDLQRRGNTGDQDLVREDAGVDTEQRRDNSAENVEVLGVRRKNSNPHMFFKVKTLQRNLKLQCCLPVPLPSETFQEKTKSAMKVSLSLNLDINVFKRPSYNCLIHFYKRDNFSILAILNLAAAGDSTK